LLAVGNNEDGRQILLERGAEVESEGRVAERWLLVCEWHQDSFD